MIEENGAIILDVSRDMAGSSSTSLNPKGGAREKSRTPALGFFVNSGWILVHRKLLENPICKKPHWGWLWVVLLLKANHDGAEFIWNGELMKLEKGQFVTGRKTLSMETGIPESTIEDILKYLERQQQIRQQKTTKYRVITILNWEKYQNPDRKSNNRATTKQQQSDTNKELKRTINNEKELGVAIATTPSNEAFDFFNKGDKYNELRSLLIVKIPEQLVDRELSKFIAYWTEPNKSGTRARWQLQPTFDVKRRLRTWLENIKTNKSKGKEII